MPTSAVPKSAVPTFAGLTQEDDPAEKSALPSAEEVLDRYIQKLGGYEQLESRQNVHWVSSGTTNRGETFIFESYQAEGKFHSQFTYDDGRTRARNVRTDGTLNEDGIRAGVAWELRDGVSIRVIKDAELQEYIRRRTFVCSTTTLLDNYKSVECQSIEEVHDELTYKVHLLDHDGTVIDLYFSIDTGLLMRRVAVEEFGGRKQLVTRDRHNWEKLGDTMIARDQTVSHEGVVYNYHVETYEIDVRIPKEIFETPNMILEMQEKSKKAVEPKKEPNAKAVDSSKD
ncbi:MAG: hypothetical protein AB8B55_06815 [Mariniblastus sp.]